MRKVISLFMLLLILASCSNAKKTPLDPVLDLLTGKKKDKNALLKESILAVTGLNSIESNSANNQNNQKISDVKVVDLMNVTMTIEVSVNTASKSLDFYIYNSDPKITDYELSMNNGEWMYNQNNSSYSITNLKVDETYNFRLRAKHNDKYSRIFNKKVLFKDGFVWSNLSFAWKKLIARQVSSIHNSRIPETLTIAQYYDVLDLTSFSCYYYSGCVPIVYLSPLKHFKKLTS